MVNLIKLKIAAALAGDAEAARALLREFCAAVENNRRELPGGQKTVHVKPSGVRTQFDEELLDYLALCFSLIGSYVDDGRLVTADVALNLTSPGRRGRKKVRNTRDEQLRRGMRAWELAKESGFRLQQAFESVAQAESKSVDTIERDYKLFKELVNKLG